MSKAVQKLPHKAYFLMFIYKLLPQTRKFLEIYSVLTNFDTSRHVFLLPVRSLRWCSRLSTGTTGTVDFMVFSGLCGTSTLLRSCLIWKPWKPTINSVFALEKLHRSPTLLPRVSTTGFLLIPILFHPETTRGKLVMGPFVFKSFHDHSLGMSACPADGGLCDSPMLTGELPHFLIFRKITPKGRQSVYADHPEKKYPTI